MRGADADSPSLPCDPERTLDRGPLVPDLARQTRRHARKGAGPSGERPALEASWGRCVTQRTVQYVAPPIMPPVVPVVVPPIMPETPPDVVAVPP
jgi:hypothetical protein